MWTYWQLLRPDGTIDGEGQEVTMTTDGEVVIVHLLWPNPCEAPGGGATDSP
jgi:hypothetical protein